MEDNKQLISSIYFPVLKKDKEKEEATPPLTSSCSTSSIWENLPSSEYQNFSAKAQTLEDHSRALCTVQEIGLVIDEISSTPSAPPNTPDRFESQPLFDSFGQTVEEEVTSWPTKILRFVTNFLRPTLSRSPSPLRESTNCGIEYEMDASYIVSPSLIKAIQAVEVKPEQIQSSTPINALLQEFMREVGAHQQQEDSLVEVIKKEEGQPSEVEATRRMGTHRVSFKPKIESLNNVEDLVKEVRRRPITRHRSSSSQNSIRKTTTSARENHFKGQTSLGDFIRRFVATRQPPPRPNYLAWLGPNNSISRGRIFCSSSRDGVTIKSEIGRGRGRSD